MALHFDGLKEDDQQIVVWIIDYLLSGSLCKNTAGALSHVIVDMLPKLRELDPASLSAEVAEDHKLATERQVLALLQALLTKKEVNLAGVSSLWQRLRSLIVYDGSVDDEKYTKFEVEINRHILLSALLSDQLPAEEAFDEAKRRFPATPGTPFHQLHKQIRAQFKALAGRLLELADSQEAAVRLIEAEIEQYPLIKLLSKCRKFVRNLEKRMPPSILHQISQACRRPAATKSVKSAATPRPLPATSSSSSSTSRRSSAAASASSSSSSFPESPSFAADQLVMAQTPKRLTLQQLQQAWPLTHAEWSQTVEETHPSIVSWRKSKLPYTPSAMLSSSSSSVLLPSPPSATAARRDSGTRRRLLYPIQTTANLPNLQTWDSSFDTSGIVSSGLLSIDDIDDIIDDDDDDDDDDSIANTTAKNTSKNQRRHDDDDDSAIDDADDDSKTPALSRILNAPSLPSPIQPTRLNITNTRKTVTSSTPSSSSPPSSSSKSKLPSSSKSSAVRAKRPLVGAAPASEPKKQATAAAKDTGGKRRVWSAEEENALIELVKRHGVGRWNDMKNDPEYSQVLAERSTIHLKDKWRNLLKYRHLIVES